MDIKPIHTPADHAAALKEVERLWDRHLLNCAVVAEAVGTVPRPENAVSVIPTPVMVVFPVLVTTKE